MVAVGLGRSRALMGLVASRLVGLTSFVGNAFPHEGATAPEPHEGPPGPSPTRSAGPSPTSEASPTPDLLTINRTHETLLLTINMSPTSEVPYGTLDLMVLKTLAALSPLHGYGVARRIEQVAQGSLALNQGTIYPALLRLEQKGWIKSDWGMSENNRRARFYSITPSGKRQLAAETDLWAQTVATVNRLMAAD